MSEFKGTKAKWSVDYSTYFEGQGYIPIKSNIKNRTWIAETKSNHVNKGMKSEEMKANALLISKAPEMLKMLERLSNHFDLFPDDRDSIKNLIKSATEL